MTALITYSGGSLEITATSIAYNTVIDVVRYNDAIKYVVKSSADLEVVAPRWEFGGEFYNQFITTAALMHSLLDKPFNVSCKDIIEENIRPEVNGDFEIQADNKIFIGRYQDFYRDYVIARFNLMPLEDYELTTNERYACNRAKVGFKNYASQKEAEQGNTYDIVHGKTEWLLPGLQVENTREIQIGFIRDAFLIEQTRRKAYDLTDTAATQDDDKIFIIDAIEDDTVKSFTVTATVQHVATETGINLRNDQTFSWVLLGIVPTSSFVIENGDNAGTYTVIGVTGNELQLYSGSAGVNIPEASTSFTYTVAPDVRLINRTNEGFSLIENIDEGNNYANLNFTTKRILQKYFAEEIASSVLYAAGNIINTLYDKNPAAVTQLADETEPITEGAPYRPSGAILGPDMRKMTFSCTLQEYWHLQTELRMGRGYIATLDAKGLPFKGYVKEAEWVPEGNAPSSPAAFPGKLTATLEEKYERFYISIFGTGNGVISIENGLGDDPITSSAFTYEIDEFQNLLLFGENGKQLFVAVPYNRVKVNNSGQATNALELVTWLQSLQ